MVDEELETDGVVGIVCERVGDGIGNARFEGVEGAGATLIFDGLF